ncbi:MAG: hypothetical protein INH34_06950 [Phycisphaerales bacterium]|jgi:hypothetical protein|nr:hypothetical protein [Phycisphaerales bacterium]
MHQDQRQDQRHDQFHDIARLTRQVRVLQCASLALCAALAAFVTLGFGPPAPDNATRVEKFDEITVGRLNVAGPNGVKRFILSHDTPKAPFAGEMLERTVPPGFAAMIYCAPNGDEIGGIASADRMRLISLDYTDYPVEALVLSSGGDRENQGVSISLMHPPSGTKVDTAAADRGWKTLQSIWKSGLDGDAADAEAEKRAKTDPDLAEVLRHRKMMVQRIGIGVDPSQAGISIADRDGNDRIVMRVTETGEPEILMLDADGKEVARIPARKENSRR